MEYKHQFDTEKVIKDMADMIRCKTVSYKDENLINRSEFEKFQKLLPEKFKNLYKICKPEKIGNTGLLFSIKGSETSNDTDGNNSNASGRGNGLEKTSIRSVVLMAHYDVVPVDENEWTVPAFDGLIKDGFLWGRGTLDTKGTLCAILESIDYMLGIGWKPKANLYLSFSGEEEIDGNSCPEIVSVLEKRGVKPDFVLDEGGAIVENAFPGVKPRCAMVGIAEKGSVNIKVTIQGKAGHASAPPVHSAAGYVGQAVKAVEASPFKAEFTTPVREMLNVLGPNSVQPLKFIFSHNKFFSPLIIFISKIIGGELYALLHTTCAVTRLDASPAYNVLPEKAMFGMNLRLLGSNTIDTVTKRIEKILRKINKKAAVKVELVNGMNPSIESNVHCNSYELLKSAINKTWDGVLISPYLMMACSDSRHYCRISDKVYRFSGMFMSKEERGMIHGKDERISLETLNTTVEFYCNLLEGM